MDAYTQDDAFFHDSQWTGTTRDPKLSFSYTYAPILNIDSVSVAGNPQKGNDISFSITISNSGSGYATIIQTKIKMKADTYSWSGDICGYVDWDAYLPAGNTETHSITFQEVFSYNGKYYAWNIGDYKIDQVDAKCSQGSTDSYTTDVSFDIDTAADHKVFVAAIVFDGISTSVPTNHFSGIESNTMYVENVQETGWTSTSFGTYFSTDFIIQTFSSSDSTSGVTAIGGPDSTSTSDWTGFAVTKGQTVLGLSSNWENGNNEGWDPDERGTYSSNHGFDLLIIYTEIDDMPLGLGWQNTICINDGNTDSRVILHELLHTYMDSGTTTEHLNYSPITDPNYDLHGEDGFIMGGPGDPSWYLHPDTESRVSNRINHYDGV